MYLLPPYPPQPRLLFVFGDTLYIRPFFPSLTLYLLTETYILLQRLASGNYLTASNAFEPQQYFHLKNEHSRKSTITEDVENTHNKSPQMQ